MSGKISGTVWDLDLPKEEKFILLAYADHADHEGYNIRPGYALVAWKTGYSKRYVMEIVARLESKGILVLDEAGGFRDGKNRANEWHVNLDAAPKSPPRRKVNPVGSEPQFTTPHEPQFTPVVNHSSPQSPVEPSIEPSSSALRSDEDLSDPGDSDVYAELSGQAKDTIQDKTFVEFTDTDPAMYKSPKTPSRSLPNPTVVQPGFKNVPVVKTKPEPKRDTPPTDLEKYLLKHMANVAPNQWVRETSRLSAENRVKLSTAVTDSMSPEWLWNHDPRFREWVQDRGHYFIAKATKKNQNVLVNLVCKYDTEEHGWYAWCDKNPLPLSPAEALKSELDNWVRAYYDPRKENGMLNVEDEQNYDRMVKLYQDVLGNQVK